MVTLVLLPGLDGTGLLFADFAASLPPEVKLISVFYPPDTVLDYAGLEVLIRSYLPNNQPYFLLAESFSGPLAISIAASSPAGLRGLILCCSFARNPLPLLAPFRFVLNRLPMPTPPISLLSYLLLGRFATPSLRATLSRALAIVSPVVLRARARAVLTVDNSGLLRRIQIPMLYLRAKEDRVVPQAASELVVSLAPHTQVQEFLSPHFLMQVLPAKVAGTVIDFMDIRLYRSDSV